MCFLFINTNNTDIFIMDDYYEDNIYVRRLHNISNTCMKYGLDHSTNMSSEIGLEYRKLQAEYANTVPSKVFY